MSRVQIVTVALAALLAFAGCGGGEPGSTSTRAVLSSPPENHGSGGLTGQAEEAQGSDARQRNRSQPGTKSRKNGVSNKPAKTPSENHHDHTVAQIVKALVAGNRESPQKVVSSKKEIHEIIKEVKESSNSDGKSSDPSAVVEKLLGQ